MTDIVKVHQKATHDGATPEIDPSFTAKMSDNVLWIGFLKDQHEKFVGVMEEKK